MHDLLQKYRLPRSEFQLNLSFAVNTGIGGVTHVHVHFIYDFIGVEYISIIANVAGSTSI